MDTHELLKAGRKLIEKEENWTKFALARTSRGRVIGPRESNATCFCSVGALSALEDTPNTLIGALYALRREVAPVSVIDFNDSHTHPEVLAMWDRAIAATAPQIDPDIAAMNAVEGCSPARSQVSR